ncbi:HEAT repeat domain-containing protein, partial [Nitrososphaera sp.]|uniref:HEAT repeat domain-containing protein n=1 Tax=Nitrososphaera sp. TaxID=1971748 RepID=UPI00307D2B17
LVTCRDWQHIWLNEGFATYCEALYWEASRGTDEFHYYVMQTADDYFEEAGSRYVRPIVTKTYRHPDELFDRHAYEKAGCVLHMLRHQVGDARFRRSLKTYLQRFANGVAETDDLRKVFELETGKSLQQFFDQWLYREGHPSLKVTFSADSKAARIKVEQEEQQQHDGGGEEEPPFFSFPLEVRLVFAKGGDRIYTLDISDKESTLHIPLEEENEGEVEWFSVDPEFKVLKTVSVKAPKEMLIKQLQRGKTVIERVEAARALKEHSADAVVEALQAAVTSDFWGVAAEAAKVLGTIRTDSAYGALKKCLKGVSHPKARRAVVKALGEFRRPESIELLKEYLHDESYFVESEVMTAIGKTRSKEQAMPVLTKGVESRSFQNVVAQGAIAGLKEFADDKEVAALLVEKSRYGNHHRVREAATFALGKFAGENATVVDQLKMLLEDRWFRVRINACKAFADAEYVKAIPDLERVAERDLDHRVRRVAQECINMIREAASKPREVAQLREELDGMKARSLEMMQRLDRFERGLR